MQEGSQYLQSPWHSLHVQGAGKNGEVGSAAICNICTGETFLVEVKFLPFSTQEGRLSVNDYAVPRAKMPSLPAPALASSSSRCFFCTSGGAVCAGFAQVTLVDLRSSYQPGSEAKRKNTQKAKTTKPPPNKTEHKTAGATCKVTRKAVKA